VCKCSPVIGGTEKRQSGTKRCMARIATASCLSLKNVGEGASAGVQIHWPVTEPQTPGEELDPPLASTWAAMEKLVDEVRPSLLSLGGVPDLDNGYYPLLVSLCRSLRAAGLGMAFARAVQLFCKAVFIFSFYSWGGCFDAGACEEHWREQHQHCDPKEAAGDCPHQASCQSGAFSGV